MCETGHKNLTFITVEQKIPWKYLEASLRYCDLLKTAYYKHFEHFLSIDKFKKTNFTANHGEYL